MSKRRSMLGVDDRDLVDREPVVVARLVADEPDRRVLLDAVGVDVGDAAVALTRIWWSRQFSVIASCDFGARRSRRAPGRGTRPARRVELAQQRVSGRSGRTMSSHDSRSPQPGAIVLAGRRAPAVDRQRLRAICSSHSASLTQHITAPPSTGFSASRTRTSPDISSGSSASRVRRQRVSSHASRRERLSSAARPLPTRPRAPAEMRGTMKPLPVEPIVDRTVYGPFASTRAVTLPGRQPRRRKSVQGVSFCERTLARPRPNESLQLDARPRHRRLGHSAAFSIRGDAHGSVVHIAVSGRTDAESRIR